MDFEKGVVLYNQYDNQVAEHAYYFRNCFVKSTI